MLMDRWVLMDVGLKDIVREGCWTKGHCWIGICRTDIEWTYVNKWTLEAIALQSVGELCNDGERRHDVGGHGVAKRPWVPQRWWMIVQCQRPQCYKSKNFFFLLTCLLFPRHLASLLFYCLHVVLLFLTQKELWTLYFIFVHTFFSLFLGKRCLLFVNNGCQSLVFHHLVILIQYRKTSGNNLMMLILFLKKRKVLLQLPKPNPFFLQ